MADGTTPITTIYLVRHGETEWNRIHRYQGSTDIPLNATGERQAQQLAQYLRSDADAPVGDAIVSSPLSRAFATARAIGEAVGISEIMTDARLQERGYGVAEGLTLEEREARWPEPNWEGLESWETVAERTIAALDEVVVRHAGERVFVVCHGGVINAILSVISGGEVGTGKTVIINTSISTLTHDANGWEIGTINQVSHFEREAVIAD